MKPGGKYYATAGGLNHLYILSKAAIREQMTPEKTRQLTQLIEELLSKQRSISIASDKGIFRAEKCLA